MDHALSPPELAEEWGLVPRPRPISARTTGGKGAYRKAEACRRKNYILSSFLQVDTPLKRMFLGSSAFDAGRDMAFQFPIKMNGAQ